VLPTHVLDKALINVSLIRPSTITSKAYDGLSKQVIGNIKIILVINPKPFQVTFQVMDIQPSYNMFERPWIHTAGVAASYLLQRVKFIINGGLVIVKAEETLLMIENMEVPYIETKDNIDGNLHDFKVVNAE
jgi:hypothetical protein